MKSRFLLTCNHVYNKDYIISALFWRPCQPEYDSRMKAMAVDERPTQQYSYIVLYRYIIIHNWMQLPVFWNPSGKFWCILLPLAKKQTVLEQWMLVINHSEETLGWRKCWEQFLSPNFFPSAWLICITQCIIQPCNH